MPSEIVQVLLQVQGKHPAEYYRELISSHLTEDMEYIDSYVWNRVLECSDHKLLSKIRKIVSYYNHHSDYRSLVVQRKSGN